MAGKNLRRNKCAEPLKPTATDTDNGGDGGMNKVENIKLTALVGAMLLSLFAGQLGSEQAYEVNDIFKLPPEVNSLELSG